MEDDEQDTGSGSVEQLSKSLVRYAISCEHSRKPIKRQDINEKGESSLRYILATLTVFSTRLTYKTIQRRLGPRQLRAYGCVRHAVEGATKGGEGDGATEARYVSCTHCNERI